MGSDSQGPSIFPTCCEKSIKMVAIAAPIPTPTGSSPLPQVHLRIRKAAKAKTAALSSIKIRRVRRRLNGIRIQLTHYQKPNPNPPEDFLRQSRRVGSGDEGESAGRFPFSVAVVATPATESRTRP